MLSQSASTCHASALLCFKFGIESSVFSISSHSSLLLAHRLRTYPARLSLPRRRYVPVSPHFLLFLTLFPSWCFGVSPIPFRQAQPLRHLLSAHSPQRSASHHHIMVLAIDHPRHPPHHIITSSSTPPPHRLIVAPHHDVFVCAKSNRNLHTQEDNIYQLHIVTLALTNALHLVMDKAIACPQ
jgi:hypothetical protein